jgi:hypothetical protein
MRSPNYRDDGPWALRVLALGGLRAERSVQADYGQVTTVDVAI